MKWYQQGLVRLASIALILSLAQSVNAACDLQIAAGSGPCLGDGTAGIPKAGDAYGLKLVLNIVGKPSQPFNIVITMANQSYTISNVTVGAGSGYHWSLEWALQLDDPIPWSITVDPGAVSGDTNLANNVASGVFTPTPPAAVVELYDSHIWRGFETSLIQFQPGSGTIDSLYVLFGVPTTHGAQSVISLSDPVGSTQIITAPYNEAVDQIARLNVAPATFQDSNSFVVLCSSIRVNPTILRTNTWAAMSAMSTNWTVWLAPDARCQSTDPAITAFVQSALPNNYKSTMTPYDVARTLHKKVMATLTYLEPPPHIDAVNVLADGIADCGGYAALLTASLRNAGIPARCVSGFRSGEQIPHVRTEFHLPGVDWLLADANDGWDYDPTGTYAYDFGLVPDGNSYVAVDYGDAHVLPYNTFELIQVPNPWYLSGTATMTVATNTFGLMTTPGIALVANPSNGGTVSGTGVYTAGASVPISATANSHWAFTDWNDGNTQNPRNVTVPAAGTNYVANFVQVAPAIALSGNLSFGNVSTGTTATASLIISNTGVATMTVTSLTYPTGYSGPFSGTIPAGGSHTVPVSFTPPAIGAFSGLVTVNSDALSGTDTINASGSGVPTVIKVLTFTKMSLKLNFAKPNADACSMTATFDPGANFQPAGQTLVLNIGGAQLSFPLTAKGGVSGSSKCSLKAPKAPATIWSLTISMKAGSWATDWATYGLTNATTSKPGTSVVLPVEVNVNNEVFTGNSPTMVYTATAGKSGSAK